MRSFKTPHTKEIQKNSQLLSSDFFVKVCLVPCSIDFCNSGKGSNKLVDMLIASMESPSVPPIIRFLAVAFPFTL